MRVHKIHEIHGFSMNSIKNKMFEPHLDFGFAHSLSVCMAMAVCHWNICQDGDDIKCLCGILYPTEMEH